MRFDEQENALDGLPSNASRVRVHLLSLWMSIVVFLVEVL